MDKHEPIKWPSWRYGPNGEAQIFETEGDVPEGWLDHPAKFKKEGENEAVATASSDDEKLEVETVKEDATSPVKPSSKSKKKSGK